MTRSVRLALMVGGSLVVANIWLSVSALDLGDFPQLHDSARAVLAGEDIYLSGTPTVQGTRNLNPPHVALIMSPLALLPLTAAAILMWTIILGAFVLFAAAVFRNWPRNNSWAFLAVILVSAASNVAISLINIAWPLAAATAWAYTWLRAGRVRRAVITVGVLASVKLFYFAFVPYWIWRKDWHALKWFTATIGVVFASGALLLGWSPYVTWVSVLKSASLLSDQRPLDASWHGVVTRLSDGGTSVQSGWFIGVALIMLGTWWGLRRTRAGADDWGLLLTSMLLISPLGWVYYALIAALPAAVVMLARRQHVPLRLIGAGLAVPPVVIVLIAENVSNRFASALINSVYGITLTFAWFVLARGHRATPVPSVEHAQLSPLSN